MGILNKRRFLIMCIGLFCTCYGCSNLENVGSQEDLYVSEIVLSDSEVYMKPGETKMLTAEVYPDKDAKKSLIWSSRNEPVVTVSDGLLTAVNYGTAAICVETPDGRVQAFCIVRVLDPDYVPVTGMSLDKSELQMLIGEEATLTAIISPDNATNKKVKWRSSNSDVATVVDGKVVAKAEGDAVITATTVDGEKEAACKVKISKLSISFAESNVELKEGEEFNLEVIITPSFVSDVDLEWSSSDESVVSVIDDGHIVAHKIGTSVISAVSKDGELKISCNVTVKRLNESIDSNEGIWR